MMNLKLDREVKVIVKGEVQGVGFRASVQILARRLKLFGTARNLLDGSVEIFALGSKESVDQLLKALHENRVAGDIKNVSVEEVSTLHPFDRFAIL